ncbi:MAG: hypothetical protein RI885_2369 [Actinomycetota bacterium]
MLRADTASHHPVSDLEGVDTVSVKAAIHYPSFSFPGGSAAIASTLAATAKAADEGGIDTFTLMDHYFQIQGVGPADAPMLEGYTGLGFVAAHTSRMQLGLLVTGVTYRHPALLAKIVTTLDVLSSGRAFLGLGAAWFEREHVALGVPYPAMSERFRRLEEAIQICCQMWSDDDGPYSGEFYQLAETLCVPQPITRPRPPLLLGGGGEKKTLRLVAQYADATNLFGGDVEVITHKLDVLRRHCDDLGRDFDSIEKTTIGYRGDPLGDTDGFLAEMQTYAAAGISKVWVSLPSTDPAPFVTQFSEKVLPRMAEI